MQFEGTAVYMISSRERPGGLLHVYIDGEGSGDANRWADLLEETCGFTIFQRENLPFGTHNITVVFEGRSPQVTTEDGYIALQRFVYVFVALRFLISNFWLVRYTTMDATDVSEVRQHSTSTSATSASTSGSTKGTSAGSVNWPPVIAGICAGAIAICLVVAWVILRRRSSRRAPLVSQGFAIEQSESPPPVTPYELSSATTSTSTGLAMHTTYPLSPLSSHSHGMAIPTPVHIEDPNTPTSPHYPPSAPSRWNSSSTSSAVASKEKEKIINAMFPGSHPIPLSDHDIARIAQVVAQMNGDTIQTPLNASLEPGTPLSPPRTPMPARDHASNSHSSFSGDGQPRLLAVTNPSHHNPFEDLAPPAYDTSLPPRL